MNTKPNDNKEGNREIPDSSSKTARGSKQIHSEKDNSTQRGFERKAGKEEE